MGESVNKKDRGYNILGTRVKQLMYENGMKTKDLAEELNLSCVAISKILDGTRGGSIETLLGLSKALHTSVSYLLGEIDYKGDLKDYISHSAQADSNLYIKLGEGGFLKIKGEFVAEVN